jgi:hypothetical protein
MNRDLANNILRNGGSGQAGMISFSRCNQETIETIEAMGDEELNLEMRSAYWITYIYGQFSIGDLQYVELLALELDSRGWTETDWDKFNEWADDEKIKFDESQEDSMDSFEVSDSESEEHLPL